MAIKSLCLALVAASLPAFAVPITRLDLQSDPGDFIGAGLNYSYTPADGTFRIPLAGDLSGDGAVDNFNLLFNGSGGIFWVLMFDVSEVAPSFTARTYDNASRPQSGSLPGMYITGLGRGCNSVSGSFAFPDVTFGPPINSATDSAQASFVMTFEQRCDGSAAALRGTLYYNYEVRTAAVPEPATGSLAGGWLLAAWAFIRIRTGSAQRLGA